MSTFDDFLLKLRNTSDDKDIARLVRHVSRNNLEPHEVASLATKLADSGSSLPASAKATADIPSTGGPSSLSTLVCPLFLRLKGFVVPKLAVPGRPAGGIDVLATIPGYETDLVPWRSRRWLQPRNKLLLRKAKRPRSLEGQRIDAVWKLADSGAVPLWHRLVRSGPGIDETVRCRTRHRSHPLGDRRRQSRATEV